MKCPIYPAMGASCGLALPPESAAREPPVGRLHPPYQPSDGGAWGHQHVTLLKGLALRQPTPQGQASDPNPCTARQAGRWIRARKGNTTTSVPLTLETSEKLRSGHPLTKESNVEAFSHDRSFSMH